MLRVIHLRAISQEGLMYSIRDMCLEVTLLQSFPRLPSANELIKDDQMQ